jgi:hypothetical protein
MSNRFCHRHHKAQAETLALGGFDDVNREDLAVGPQFGLSRRPTDAEADDIVVVERDEDSLPVGQAKDTLTKDAGALRRG